MSHKYSQTSHLLSLRAAAVVGLFAVTFVVFPAWAAGYDRHNIIIGTELDYPPYSFLNEKGEPTGFNVELTRAISKAVGQDIEIRIGPWGEIRNALQEGEIDAIAGMYYSKERDRLVDFSQPFSIVHHAVFARTDSADIESMEDLRGKRIIVMQGDIMHDYVLSERLSDKPILVDTQAKALRLLASGRHDYALLAKLPGLHWVRELKLRNIRTVGPLVQPRRYGFAVQEGDAELLAALSEGMAIAKETGHYQKLNSKWLGILDTRSPSVRTILKYILAITIPLALVIALLLLWSRLLKKEVARRTKQLHTELHERKAIEEKLRTITDSALDAVIMMDVNGNVAHWNPAAERMFGFCQEEVLGRKVHRLLAPNRYCQPAEHGLAHFAHTGQGKAIGKVLELEALRKDGSEFPIDIAIASVRLGDEWTAVATIRDITERKVNEQELKNYAAVVEANNKALEEVYEVAKAATQAKSEFLANMSHEIRTPMTAILGFADILHDVLEKPEDLESITTIKRNGEFLLQIINDILDLSKIESGKMEMKLGECSLWAIAEEVVLLLRVTTEGKGVALESGFTYPLPMYINTDAVRLRQILVNLLGNAIKFTEQGSVRLDVCYTDVPDTGPRVEFAVTDTGIGMNEDQIARAFHPFSQADNSTSRRFGGTGLGLTISKRLAEALGGDIRIESHAGKGTTVTLTIDPGPRACTTLISDPPAVAVQGKEPPDESQTHDLRGRVLFAEDGPDNQRLIGFLLRKAGLEVDIAENGRIAFEMALASQTQGRPYDLILMDIQMPELDGCEATRKLRESG
ncbi:MAG TPA: transporter substrate-binding domain-containing protein, partial [Thermoguttaceae bacterium]|nr:transporter substrate-binding domain-containing protein [Thermoguttaceae bacterium]